MNEGNTGSKSWKKACIHQNIAEIRIGVDFLAELGGEGIQIGTREHAVPSIPTSASISFTRK